MQNLPNQETCNEGFTARETSLKARGRLGKG